ncbi:MAG: peptide-methionine (S)-S-oxide reductase MsrA [Nocardioidaceae bacterium]
MLFGRHKTSLPSADEALGGRDDRPFAVGDRHTVLGTPLEGEQPAGYREAVFGMGCFWGEERKFWQVPGVWSTSVGYAGGHTENPTYKEVCSGRTGHGEVVRVVYDPARVSYEQLLKVFWEGHDPTQGMRQGNDVGTQYRSVILYTDEAQRQAAEASRSAYADVLGQHHYGEITTSIVPLETYYYAEDYHQQYLDKNPMGYCGVGGTGVTCPIGTGVATD